MRHSSPPVDTLVFPTPPDLARLTSASAPSPVFAALETHLGAVRTALAAVPAAAVEPVVDAIVRVHAARGHVVVLGNGGSAAAAAQPPCDPSQAPGRGAR